jgi:hypothetical protein
MRASSCAIRLGGLSGHHDRSVHDRSKMLAFARIDGVRRNGTGR